MHARTRTARTPTVRTWTGLAAVAFATALAGTPALAESGAPTERSIIPEGAEVQGFERVRRAPLPGERVLGNQSPLAAAPTSSLVFRGADVPVDGQAFQGYGGPVDGEAAGGGFSLRVAPGDGTIYSRSDTRLNRLTGNDVLVYENPFGGSTYGYNPRTGYYDRFHGRLSYNHAFLRHLHGDSMAGVPSVSAPVDFWTGRR